ncbi:FecR family protein [Chitinophaga qingshengii]|uniref:FecR family protein n=1 Tax=Chitinophaga qingshengii TaxID=1569794 RepID=A0ABR7TI38_9BACT|nr:FecR family protein [Chitinophaga qingshengii]MBC9930171.1 FecR family protein [Chitinophaga qingshengii]
MGKADHYLLQQFLDGRCSEEERRQVAILLETPEGRAILDELMRRREMMAWDYPPEENEEMQELLRRRQQEMQQRIAVHEGKRSRTIDWRKSLRYAAIWGGLMILSGLALWKSGKGRTDIHYVEMTNPNGVPARHVLPDSTVVYLAAGSRLKYPDTYPQTGRSIELQGEAFFDVKQDKAHPFTILTGTMLTRVLGTSFRITAYDGKEQEVIVATGKVSVSMVQQEKVTELAQLTAGRKITYHPATGEAVPGMADISHMEQWMAGDLMLADMTMGEVATILERRYGVTFRFANTNAAKHMVSGTFSAASSLMEVLDMLGFVGKFSYRLSADGKICTIQ